MLLLTIGVMAALGGKVLSGVTSSTSDPARITGPVLPADTTVLDESGADDELSAVDVARDVACSTDRFTLQTASSAYEVLHGAVATDQQTLVEAGLLSESIASHKLSIVDGALVIEGIGDCIDE